MWSEEPPHQADSDDFGSFAYQQLKWEEGPAGARTLRWGMCVCVSLDKFKFFAVCCLLSSPCFFVFIS